MISYYLAPVLASIGITRSTDQGAVNLGIQMWNFVVSTFGAFACDKWGRRKLWLLSTSLMIGFMSIITIVAAIYATKDLTAAGIAVVPLLFLFFASFDIAYTPLFIAYPTEILPFGLRAKGMATTLLVDSAAAFANQYANPVAFEAMGWRYYCVFISTLFFFLACIYLFFPETKGGSLEQNSKIFSRDDDDAMRTPIGGEGKSKGAFLSKKMGVD